MEIRLVDAVEPVLSAAEYKKVTNATPPVILTCPSGDLYGGDGIVPVGKSARTKVEPGNYAVVLFGFRTSRSDKVIAVLTSTSASPPNEGRRELDPVFE